MTCIYYDCLKKACVKKGSGINKGFQKCPYSKKIQKRCREYKELKLGSKEIYGI